MDADGVTRLSALPSRDVLLAQVAGALGGLVGSHVIANPAEDLQQAFLGTSTHVKGEQP